MHSGLRILIASVPMLICVGGLTRPAQAQATNFRQEWQDIKDAIPYLGQTREPIDFTERAPLVVPPSNDLPPPQQAGTQLGLNDPDAIDRRKALSDPRRPVPLSDPGATARGPSARAYLIEPPSGMQDPAAVSSLAKADGFVDKKPRHKKHAEQHVQKRTAAPAEVQ